MIKEENIPKPLDDNLIDPPIDLHLSLENSLRESFEKIPCSSPNEKIESAKYVVLGNVDAGKSTFVGVMEKDILDDGRGHARSLITRFKHEIDRHCTSSHTPHYLINGNEITTLIDLCGHEKYFKTTMFGVTGLFCDYGLLIIGGNTSDSDVNHMTKDHLALLISNNIPFLVIVTKIDISPEKVAICKRNLNAIAANRNHRKQIIYFEEEEQCDESGSYLKSSHREIISTFQERATNLMPVIMISNKTGHNIKFVREFIIGIKSRNYLMRTGCIPKVLDQKTASYPMVMYVDSVFSVQGIGIVLSGTVKYGVMTLGQKIYIGPVGTEYVLATIKCMKNCVSENVSMIAENESGSIGLRLDSKGSYSKKTYSKGQIVTTDLEFFRINTCYTFNCTVYIFNHPTTIRNGYQGIIHCGTIRQAGRFKIEGGMSLRTNHKEVINIKFVSHPEFILPGTRFMFRDGKTKGAGLTKGIGLIDHGIPYLLDKPDFNKHSGKFKHTKKVTEENVGDGSKEGSKVGSMEVSKEIQKEIEKEIEKS